MKWQNCHPTITPLGPRITGFPPTAVLVSQEHPYARANV
jgi:hypothetical protein